MKGTKVLVFLGTVCVIAAVLAASSPGAPPPADAGAKATPSWPCWRGPAGTGISTESSEWATGRREGTGVAWKASLGAGYTSFSIVGDRVYTMGNTKDVDTLWCFKAATGETIWKYSYPCKALWGFGEYRGPRSTPTVDGDRIFWVSAAGQLHCVDDKGAKVFVRDLAGELKVKPPMWGFACSPVVMGKQLIVDMGYVVALDKATGKTIWQSQAYGPAYSTPAIFEMDGKTYIAAFNQLGLVVLDASNGKTTGSVPWKTEFGINAVTPIFSDGKLFVSSGYDIGCALFKLEGGKPVLVWKNREMSNHCNSCILYQGNLYGFSGNVAGRGGSLVCMDFQTGKVKWSKTGLGVGSLMIAGGNLVIMGEGGDLVIASASPEAYKELSRSKYIGGICWTMPILYDKRIFCRNEKGDMICVVFMPG